MSTKKVKKENGADGVKTDGVKTEVIEIKVREDKVNGWIDGVRGFFKKLGAMKFEFDRSPLLFKPGTGLVQYRVNDAVKNDFVVDDENLDMVVKKLRDYLGRCYGFADKNNRGNDMRLIGRASHFLNGFVAEIKKVSK